MFRKKTLDPAPTFWIAATALPATPATTFFARLGAALNGVGFGDAVRAACAPYYEMDARKGGAPGIDPEVFFKMLMVGFFENIASERGIAARCADSLAIRAFLQYELTERLPDHSSLSVIRQRLPLGVFDQVFALILRALAAHKLLKGKRLAIDTSVLEANASLRSLEHRLTGEEYREYVQRLAAAAGIDPADTRAVRTFDRKRAGRTTSNTDWVNPHDPEAKVGPDKKGVIRMVYKPEHVVDADTGAIVEVAITPGDQADGAALEERIGAAEARINAAKEVAPGTVQVQVVTADMGYFVVEQLGALQEGAIATAIPDPVDQRRDETRGLSDRVVIMRARRMAASVAGRAALRKRGETVERSFVQVLDHGAARRTTLRGQENIAKRYFVQAACANLALLLRTLGVPGTLKQTLAAAAALLPSLRLLMSVRRWLQVAVRRIDRLPRHVARSWARTYPQHYRSSIGSDFSTVS